MLHRRSEKEEFWRLVLSEFSGSGLSVREFCQQEGLSEPSFYSWRKKIAQQDGELQADFPELVPVRVVPGAESEIGTAGRAGSGLASLANGDVDLGLEITTLSGLKVRIGEGCSLELIRRTILAIQISVSESSSC